MKKSYKSRTRAVVIAGFAAIVLTSGILFAFNYSSNHEVSNEPLVINEAAYTIPQLLQRDKELSYDEFIKIEEKYNKLVLTYQNNPSDAESLLKLAEIFIFEARVTGEHPYYYNAALKTLDQVIDHQDNLTPDQRFNALFYKATVQLSQHNFTEALETGKKALAINDVNSGIYGVLVDANVELGNYEAAVDYSDKMMTIRPDLRSYSRVSYLREIYGDLKGSIASMQLAINAGAPYSEYKCWTIVTLGKMYEEHNQLDSAALCYRFALKERENYPFGVAGLASIEAKKGHLEAADSLYKAALKVLPEISFTIARARLYKEAGRTEEYKKLVGEIENMFREDIASGHNMNLEYAQFLNEFKHDYNAALALGLKEYKKRPGNIDVNRLLAFTYYAKGDPKKAATYADNALRTHKLDADSYCIAGLAKKDKQLVRKSFAIDPYQDHAFAGEAKQTLQ